MSRAPCASIFTGFFLSMRALHLLIVLAMLAGCGHKGPLYLPKPQPDAKKPAQPAPPPQSQKAEE